MNDCHIRPSLVGAETRLIQSCLANMYAWAVHPPRPRQMTHTSDNTWQNTDVLNLLDEVEGITCSYTSTRSKMLRRENNL